LVARFLAPTEAGRRFRAGKKRKRATFGAMSRSIGALMVLAAVAGCGGAGRPPVIEQAPTGEVPARNERALGEEPSPPSSTTRLRPPCDILRDLVASAKFTFPEQRVAPSSPPCLDGRGGAYSMMTTYVGEATNAESHGGGYLAQLVLVHATAMGQITQSAPFGIEQSALESEDWTLEGLADFDADGVDELMTTRRISQFEANGGGDASVWQLAGDRIEPYRASVGLDFQQFHDADSDGLPDLELATPFAGTINSCGPDGEWIEFGPKLIAHSSAGRFVLDEVSQAAARELCPEKPRNVVPRARGGVDNTELRRRLACAVMWGTPTEVIVRDLEQHCPPPLPPTKPEWMSCDFDGVLPECVNLRQLTAWAAVKPPFVLR
jgi:hypothetical protein